MLETACRKLSNCWEILKLYILQRNDETDISVNVIKNYKDWVISSQTSNRGRFNDQL